MAAELGIFGAYARPSTKTTKPKVPNLDELARKAQQRRGATVPSAVMSGLAPPSESGRRTVPTVPKPKVPTAAERIQQIAEKAQQRGGTTWVASGAAPPSESGRGRSLPVGAPPWLLPPGPERIQQIAEKAEQRRGTTVPSMVTAGLWPPSESGRGTSKPRVPVVPTVPAQPKPAPAPTTQTTPQPTPQQQPQQPSTQLPTSQPIATQAPAPAYGAGQAQGGAPSNLMNTAVQYATQIQQTFASSGPDIQAMLAGLQEQYLSELSSLEQRITRMFQEQMGGIDPATQAALAQLRQTVEEQRRQLWDEMNRRGLLQSGIALEMLDRLHRNQLTAEQQIIANQFRALQQQMNQALLSFAQQRLEAIRTFGLAGIQAAERQALTAQDIKWKALQMGLSLAEAEEAGRRWEEEMGFRRQQFEAQQQQWQQQFESQRQQAEREAEQWLKEYQLRQRELNARLATPPPRPEDVARQSAFAKLQAGASFNDLTEAEKIAIGWKPWQQTTGFGLPGLPGLPGATAPQAGPAAADQQIEQAIRTGLASGLSPDQIRQELIRMGIDPRRYAHLLP